MSENNKIPYFFDTPIPKYFRETGWFNTANSVLFITWAFSKCSPDTRTVVHDHKEITLAPYEFITGRAKSSAECLLTEDAFKHQLKIMQKAGFLKKTPNSVPNRYTCYVWLTERFSKTNAQHNAQLTPNSRPTERPQSRIKKTISKESHPSSVSFEGNDGLDDLSKSSKEMFTHVFKVNDKTITIEIPISVFDECVEIKGTKEKVIEAIEYVMRSPGRKKQIQNWPNVMRTWEIKGTIKPRMSENKERCKRLCETYANAQGYRCEKYRDTKKDQEGILFYNSTSTGNPETFFIAFIDPDFNEKCDKVIRDKKMQKARIPNT